MLYSNKKKNNKILLTPEQERALKIVLNIDNHGPLNNNLIKTPSKILIKDFPSPITIDKVTVDNEKINNYYTPQKNEFEKINETPTIKEKQYFSANKIIDEWDSINKLQLLKENNKKAEIFEKRKKERETVFNYVGVQLAEKKSFKQAKLLENHQYLQYLKAKDAEEEAKYQEKKRLAKEKKLIEKEYRQSEIEKNNLKKKLAKKEKKLETIIPIEMPSELNKEKITLIKKEKLKNISNLFKEEAIEHLKQKKLDRENEKLENIEYQKAYINELEIRENNRKNLMKSKRNEVEHYLESGNNWDHSSDNLKYKNFEENREKRKKRIDLLQEINEKNKIFQKETSKEKLKEELEEQINEKKKRDLAYKLRYNGLQETLKNERILFQEYEQKINEEKTRQKEIWAKELQQQIEFRENKKKVEKTLMTEEERKINKKLINEIKKL